MTLEMTQQDRLKTYVLMNEGQFILAGQALHLSVAFRTLPEAVSIEQKETVRVNGAGQLFSKSDLSTSPFCHGQRISGLGKKFRINVDKQTIFVRKPLDQLCVTLFTLTFTSDEEPLSAANHTAACH